METDEKSKKGGRLMPEVVTIGETLVQNGPLRYVDSFKKESQELRAILQLH